MIDNLKDKNVIFVLTYSEADHWVNFYNDKVAKQCFPRDEYQLIILDNGDQQIMREWAEKNGAIYHKSKNNIGTTGGYNYFIKVGHLLQASRIAVMQADVFVHDPLAIRWLFRQKNGNVWEKEDFVYYPNKGKNSWTVEGDSCDVGQFFSLNPTFFLENNYLCDENYTVTHFESVDLWVRMTRFDNRNPAKTHNALKLFYPDQDLVDNSSDAYTYHSFSNTAGEHDKWFHHNWDYYKKKWLKSSMHDLDSKVGSQMFKHGFMVWNTMPWTSTPALEKLGPMLLHHMPLEPKRNIEMGQVPYPVEYEVNAFYSKFIKQEEQEPETIKETKNLDDVETGFDKSILIIGSSGYIGSALETYLKSFDYLTTSVDSKMFGGSTPQHRTDYKLLDKEFYKKFSHIVLLAGHSSMALCNNNFDEAWDNNVTKFADLISKLESNQTLIYASSGSVYGQDGLGRSEYMTLASAQGEYDLTKQMIEKLAYGAKCRTVGLRFGTVNGYNKFSRSDLMLNAMVINAINNKKIECHNGINHRSILGINDCVSAIKKIIDNTNPRDCKLEQHEIFNLASFSGSIKSFAETAGSILKVPVVHHPEVTNLFSFELDTNKFANKFNFKFKETIESIIKSVVDNYDDIVWSKRIRVDQNGAPVQVKQPTIAPKPVAPVTLPASPPKPKVLVPTVLPFEGKSGNIEYRLYYDDKGNVLFYTCEKPEGKFIKVDSQTYSEMRYDIRIIDGKGYPIGSLNEMSTISDAPTTTVDAKPIVKEPKQTSNNESYKRLDKCLCCGNEHLFEILDLGNQPLANSFHSPDETLEEYELKLMGCDECWHAQLSIAVNPDLLFKNYLYTSGTSKTLKEYFEWFADSLNHYNMGESSVLDIACNDGTQLDYFKKNGWKTYGVDPAKNLHSISTGKGHEVVCDYWSMDVSNQLPKFDLIIAQNVFAHTVNVEEFLQACKNSMTNTSRLIIQTSQAEMFERNQFDAIYHEHISYFSVSSMKKIVERAGMHLVRTWKPNVHGLSYFFEISKTKPKIGVSNIPDEMKKESIKYDRNFYENYRVSTLKCLSDLKDYIEKNKDKKIIGYGAAAKGMTVLNAGGIKLAYIVDDSPLKQGLLCPGNDIPVKSNDVLRQEFNDIIIIPLAWNFFDEIRNKVRFLRPNNNDTFVLYFPTLRESGSQ